MWLPQGRLCRSTVVSTVSSVLALALDLSLTGYGVFSMPETPRAPRGLITFDGGVPGCCYHPQTSWDSTAALSRIASYRPCRVDLYQLSRPTVRSIHDRAPETVDPTLPASQLDGDSILLQRTKRRHSKRESNTAPTNTDTVVSFLEDSDRIRALQETTRQTVQLRARRWNLASLLENDH
ncbi:hypothetical protein [Halocatena halophila]|uniref:hypothetical protein n=1 Tax=Halocatena halophila TaxID=2814576 RepID=UPI002ED565A2